MIDPSSLHVVHMTSVHPPFDTRIFHKECRSLAANGFRVTLLAVLDEDAVVDGVSVIGLPKPGSRLERMTRTSMQILRRALSLKADVYHFHDPELLPVGFALKAVGKRVVYDVHEDVVKDMLHKPYLPRWVGRLLSALARIVHLLADRFFDGIVTVTPTIASGFSKATLVRNYPAIEEFDDIGQPYFERAASMTYLGNISQGRGSSVMIEAAKRLQPWSNRHLLLAGPIFDVGLQATLAALDPTGPTRYVGVLDRPGVRDALRTTRLGLALLQPTYEGFKTAYPTKLFEYMAAGIPVVVSDFPIWREIVDDARCGLLVDPTNVEEIVDAITWLFDHEEEALTMGRNGRQRVLERYSWEIEAQRLSGLYRCIVGPD